MPRLFSHQRYTFKFWHYVDATLWHTPGWVVFILHLSSTVIPHYYLDTELYLRGEYSLEHKSIANRAAVGKPMARKPDSIGVKS